VTEYILVFLGVSGPAGRVLGFERVNHFTLGQAPVRCSSCGFYSYGREILSRGCFRSIATGGALRVGSKLT